VTSLKNNLNAEVVLGTVTNVKEACTWLGYTYLFVRMLKNPLVYGMTWEEVLTYTSDSIFYPIHVLALIFRFNVYRRLLLSI
jgi:activating signal cointegrator complex subunit 3